jgi:hypothetical protein
MGTSETEFILTDLGALMVRHRVGCRTILEQLLIKTPNDAVMHHMIQFRINKQMFLSVSLE